MSILTALIIGLFIGNNSHQTEVSHSYDIKRNVDNNKIVSISKNDELYINMCIGKNLSLNFDNDINRISTQDSEVNKVYLHHNYKSVIIKANEKVSNNNQISIRSGNTDYFLYINTIPCGNTNPFVKHFDISLAQIN